MANNQKNVQPKVVTTTTTTTSRRRGRRRRRTPRTFTSRKTTVRQVATSGQSRRPSRRRPNRPGNSAQSNNSIFIQRITATLGTVGSNQGEKIELEMSALINPALIKETTGSNAYGPLQMYASNYSLWRVKFLTLKLTPLVGGSAVSGTAIRASLNMSGQPGSPSWSALGARRHRDTNPGRPLYFFLSGKEFKGPKDGWFFCNTKNDPQMCTAGSLEIHTMGQTISTYQNKQFEGPLFLAEMTCTWSFKGYNPQPGMSNLVKAELKEEGQAVKINSKPGEPITISVPANSPIARTTGVIENSVDAAATPSDIIWMVCDTTMDAVTGTLPAPFSWLFKAGWWFLKRIANKKKNGESVVGEPDVGEVTYQVFQSMTDAMNDTPCIATSQAASTNATVTNWNITQITPGNVGQPAASSAATMRVIGIDPEEPFYLTRDRIKLGEGVITGLNFNNTWGIPLNGFAVQGVNTPGKYAYTYLNYELLDPVFFQQSEIDPATADVPTYPMLKKTADSYEEIGKVYATSGGTYSSNPTIQWRLALWKCNKTVNVVRQPNADVRLQYFILQPRLSQAGGYPTTLYTLHMITAQNPSQQTVSVEAGKWYIAVFSAINGRDEFTNYGATYPFPTHRYEGATPDIEPTPDMISSGFALNSAIPLKFAFNTNQSGQVTISMVQEMLQQVLRERENQNQDPPFPLLPPSSEYDNLEMPPLEGEEEDQQGAIGVEQQRSRPVAPIMQDETYLQRDTKNWVEFGHRKRPPTPFSPVEEEEEDEEDFDLDDDDYAEPPSVIKNLLTPEAKELYGHLRQKGLSHEQVTNAAQAAFPHIAIEAWDAAYHNAMADGLSPPTARDCAWAAVSDFLS
ncbi:ORF2 [Pig astrovirus CX1]|nr:ORF2 [Pig astrovirus CX1]